MAVSPATHGIRGYAIVWDVEDDKGTVFRRGCLGEPFGAGSMRPRPIPVVYAHGIVFRPSEAKPIGVVTHLSDDEIGVYFEARLLDTQEAREVLEGVDAGAIPAMSFSFPITQATFELPEEGDALSVVGGVRVYELGPCVYGSNPDAYCETYELAGDEDQAPADEATAELSQIAAALDIAAQEMGR